jgi:hypothetical protein
LQETKEDPGLDWWQQLEDDRSQDREKAERLANVISRLGGSREEKVEFLTTQMALMEAEAEREGHAPGSSRFGGMMKSLAFRYWRNELKRRGVARVPREFEEPEERKTTQEEWQQMAAELRAKRKERGV